MFGGVRSGSRPIAGGTDKRPDYVGGREGVYYFTLIIWEGGCCKSRLEILDFDVCADLHAQ